MPPVHNLWVYLTQSIAQVSRVELPSIDELSDEACLDETVIPGCRTSGRPETRPDQAGHGGLKAGVVCPVRRVVEATLPQLAVRAGETRPSFREIELASVDHVRIVLAGDHLCDGDTIVADAQGTSLAFRRAEATAPTA